MYGLCVVVLVLSLRSSVVWSADLATYQTCCHYCRGDQELWMTVSPSWTLTVQGEEVTSFQNPASYLISHEATTEISLYGRNYQIRYGGVPVSVPLEGLSNPGAVLTSQYVQVDLGFAKDIAGVSVQGGFYEEVENDLVERRRFTVTEFAISTGMSAGGLFQWVRDPSGSVSKYFGPATYDDEVLAGFHGDTVTARYVRVHPLGGRDQAGQQVEDTMMRISVVYCASDICPDARSDCVLREWQNWGACVCDWAGCTQTRRRHIARHESCGGDPCGTTSEIRTCVPPKPLWHTIALAVGVGVLGLIILIIISWCLYKRFRKAEPEIVFKKDEKRKKKETKKRKLREDLGGEDGKIKAEEKVKDDNFDDDFAEKELGREKNMGELEKGVVVTADDQPAINAKPIKEKKKKKKKKKEEDVNSLENMMNDISPDNNDGLDGLYMVTRDETVAAPKPVKPKPLGLAPLAPVGGNSGKRKDSLDELANDVLDEW